MLGFIGGTVDSSLAMSAAPRWILPAHAYSSAMIRRKVARGFCLLRKQSRHANNRSSQRKPTGMTSRARVFWIEKRDMGRGSRIQPSGARAKEVGSFNTLVGTAWRGPGGTAVPQRGDSPQ